MVSDEKLAIYTRLQQIVLDTPDNSQLINRVLPEILTLLSSTNLSYEFVSAVFFNRDYLIQQSFFVDIHSLKVQNNLFESVVNFNNLVKKETTWQNELLQGKIIVLSEVESLIFSTYFDYSHLKSLVVSPIRVGNLLNGLLVFATIREKATITTEEIEVLDMISNLVSTTFRLQDTQTSLIKITQQVYNMNAKLHQLDKLKDDFVSVASHELRTPMTAIRSYAWMALYKSDLPLTEKMKRYLSRTLISTERLINLVNDLLNISRIESGRVEIIPSSFDMLSLVKDVVAEVEAKAKEKNQTVKLLETNLPKVFADPDKVHQVLLNLLGNALKFTPQNGIISLSFFSDGRVVETKVADSGVGISQDDLSRLFTKFGRLDDSYVAAATSGGTGLGLYICKSLIDLMKGKIWARSEGLNRGAQFIFSLPVASQEVMTEAEQYTNKVAGESKLLEPFSI